MAGENQPSVLVRAIACIKSGAAASVRSGSARRHAKEPPDALAAAPLCEQPAAAAKAAKLASGSVCTV